MKAPIRPTPAYTVPRPICKFSHSQRHLQRRLGRLGYDCTKKWTFFFSPHNCRKNHEYINIGLGICTMACILALLTIAFRLQGLCYNWMTLHSDSKQMEWESQQQIMLLSIVRLTLWPLGEVGQCLSGASNICFASTYPSVTQVTQQFIDFDAHFL